MRAQNDSAPGPEHIFPRMVHEYYVNRVRQRLAARRRRLACLRTRAHADHYRTQVLRKLRRCLGPMPRRTPLNANTTAVLPRDGYRIEKLTYESRPGMIVTANLYVPDGHGPFPVVLSPCGHSHNGKAEAVYQTYCRTLALQGFMTLIYDPIGQGERQHYVSNPTHNKPQSPVEAHNMAGKHMSLLGEFLGTWMIWDGIRALDYLLMRSEADKTHVGLTGNSGGGMLTSYLHAIDSRVTMSAPSCYITSLRHHIENELPCDIEQMHPAMLAQRLDLADLLIARAPRPVLLLGQQFDSFDVRGLRMAYEQVRRIYRLLGSENNIRLYVGDGMHGYQADARQAMYRFFGEIAKANTHTREQKAPCEPDEVLYAAPKGHVSNLAGSRSLQDLTAALADQLTTHHRLPSQHQLQKLLPRVLNLPKRRGVPYYRVL